MRHGTVKSLRVIEAFGPYKVGDVITQPAMGVVIRSENHAKVVGNLEPDPPDGHKYEMDFPEPWPCDA